MTGGSLVLTGMMGTGKTSVGRELARRLDRRFIDLDSEIEKAADCTVTEIFAREGEAGFRDRERQAVHDLAGTRNAVIATGGWSVDSSKSRDTLENLGPLVCFTCTPEALRVRLGASEAASRPLLAEKHDPSNVARLLAQRRAVYDSLPLQVDTTRRDVGTVAEQVLELVDAAEGLHVTALPVVTPTNGYSVLIGAGLLDVVGTFLGARGLSAPTVVVTDRTVARLYGERLITSLRATGLDARLLEIGEGEGEKTQETVAGLYSGFLEAGLARDGTVIALGGGIVGDAAGFAAATYMRGVRLVTMPTTLLAMVDASIGGKTGVNLPQGKNLVGAFKHPALVAVDPTVLATLPPGVLRSGLAEVVKAALIGDPMLLEILERNGAPAAGDAAAWGEIVRRSAAVKTAIVSEDPDECGHRAWLNLGHTFAHALERATGYAMTHGDAVSVGLIAATRLAARLGGVDTGLVPRIERLLAALDLPVRYAGPIPDEVVAAMSTDKKRRAGQLRFVLPHALGDVRLADDVPATYALAVLQELRANEMQ